MKRRIGVERPTGALAVVNHHSNRLGTHLAAFGGDRTGRISVEYLMSCMRTGHNQLCRRAHMPHKKSTFFFHRATFIRREFILEWNPRGQVAPQVIVTNVATKQTDKGVAPQSPFEESATTSARWPVRNRVTVGVVSHPGSPFLSDFFVKKQMNSS